MRKKNQKKSSSYWTYVVALGLIYLIVNENNKGGFMFDTLLDFLWSIKWIIIVAFLLNELSRVWMGYNRIQTFIQQIQEARSNVKVAIEQKLGIINQFQPIVNQYDDHEKNIQLTVSGDYRASAQQASNALAYIHGVAMAFPELKADSNYNMFLENISKNEQLLTERRETFNKVVKEYNTFITQLPLCFLAMALGYKTEEFFDN